MGAACARSASGTPSSSAITITGSGSAKSCSRSIRPAGATASISRSASWAIVSRRPATRCGVKALRQQPLEPRVLGRLAVHQVLRLEVVEGRPGWVGRWLGAILAGPLAAQPPVAQQRDNILVARVEGLIPVRIIEGRRPLAQLGQGRVGVGDKGGVVQVEVVC